MISIGSFPFENALTLIRENKSFFNLSRTIDLVMFPLVLIGIILVFTAPSTGLDTTGGRIVLAMGLIMVLPPFLDYLFYRFKKDNLGLWDTLYGGVWMVRTTKTAEAKGWLKRLEQLGDYSDSQGWFKDKDEGDPSS